eukprot:693256-Prorocentrum_minimum.AAC.18
MNHAQRHGVGRTLTGAAPRHDRGVVKLLQNPLGGARLAGLNRVVGAYMNMFRCKVVTGTLQPSLHVVYVVHTPTKPGIRNVIVVQTEEQCPCLLCTVFWPLPVPLPVPVPVPTSDADADAEAEEEAEAEAEAFLEAGEGEMGKGSGESGMFGLGLGLGFGPTLTLTALTDTTFSSCNI